MNVITCLSDEGAILRDRDIPKLKGPFKTYNVKHDTIGTIGTAEVVEISLKGRVKKYLADRKTGSLYNPKTLRCLSGALTLREIV
jgi:hypothetical protein